MTILTMLPFCHKHNNYPHYKLERAQSENRLPVYLYAHNKPQSSALIVNADTALLGRWGVPTNLDLDGIVYFGWTTHSNLRTSLGIFYFFTFLLMLLIMPVCCSLPGCVNFKQVKKWVIFHRSTYQRFTPMWTKITRGIFRLNWWRIYFDASWEEIPYIFFFTIKLKICY